MVYVHHDLSQSCGSYHCGEKVWDAMEDGTMGILRGDKVPLRDHRSAPCGKLYLRHGLALFNVSSLLDLYAHI